jgi:hypothetical protein
LILAIEFIPVVKETAAVTAPSMFNKNWYVPEAKHHKLMKAGFVILDFVKERNIPEFSFFQVGICICNTAVLSLGEVSQIVYFLQQMNRLINLVISCISGHRIYTIVA